MKESTTKFTCDNCEEHGIHIGEHEAFPYDAGWCFLYELNTQIPSKTGTGHIRLEKKEKHFCCLKCELEYLAKVLTKPQTPTTAQASAALAAGAGK